METKTAPRPQARRFQKGYMLPEDLVIDVEHLAIDLRTKPCRFVEETLRRRVDEIKAAGAAAR